MSSSWVGSTIQLIGRLLKKLYTISISLSRRRYSCLICWHVVCSDLQWPFQFWLLICPRGEGRSEFIVRYLSIRSFCDSLPTWVTSTIHPRSLDWHTIFIHEPRHETAGHHVCTVSLSTQCDGRCGLSRSHGASIADCKMRGAFWIRPVCFW